MADQPGVPQQYQVNCPLCLETLTLLVTSVNVERIVNQDDVVYERDLGRNTVAVARAMTAYPSTWTPAESNP